MSRDGIILLVIAGVGVGGYFLLKQKDGLQSAPNLGNPNGGATTNAPDTFNNILNTVKSIFDGAGAVAQTIPRNR